MVVKGLKQRFDWIQPC